MNIKLLIDRPYAYIDAEGDARVYMKDPVSGAKLLIACALALKGMGEDVDGVLEEIENVKWKGVEA